MPPLFLYINYSGRIRCRHPITEEYGGFITPELWLSSARFLHLPRCSMEQKHLPARPAETHCQESGERRESERPLVSPPTCPMSISTRTSSATAPVRHPRHNSTISGRQAR